MFKFSENIFDAARSCRSDFFYNYIEIVPGYMFSQYATIKKAHLYYNSHMLEGDYELIDGVLRKKPFYNISKWRCDVASKQLDLDVKDFLLISNNPDTEWNVFLLERELKTWLKKSQMGKVLNELVRRLPIYGSAVLRKIKGGAEIIDLRHFYVDQAAPSLKKARYKIIKHMLSPEDLREKKDLGVWSNVDEVIDKYVSFAPSRSYDDGGSLNITAGEPYASIYEIYMEVPEKWLDGDPGSEEWYVDDTELQKFKYSHWIVAGIDNFNILPMQNPSLDTAPESDKAGVVLFKEELKHEDDPFKEVHYNKTEGRWLGLGVVEDTFEVQRLRNRYANMQDKAIELASLILFQTPTQTVHKNILAATDNGDILITGKDGGVSRLDTRQYALSEFNSIYGDLNSLADQQTFSSQILSGQAPPASATATSVINQTQQANSVFDYKKENVGLFMEEFVNDLVFPELEKKINSPHRFRYLGDTGEMKAMRRIVARAAVQNAIQQFAEKSDRDPSSEEIDAIEQQVMGQLEKAGNRIWIDVQEGFFKNLDYDMDLVTTGENRNVVAQLANVQTVLGLIARNPAILENPVLRRLLFKMMSLIGMNGSELEALESESQESQSGAQPGAVPGAPGGGQMTPDIIAKLQNTFAQSSSPGAIPGNPGGGQPISKFIQR